MHVAFQYTSCSWKVCILDLMATRAKLLNAREALGSRLCGLNLNSYDTCARHICEHLAEMTDSKRKAAVMNPKITLGREPMRIQM